MALHTQHRVILAGNINSPGSVDLELPDGQRLRSNPMGLAFFAPATGRTVLLAEVKDCPAERVEPNIVVFPGAFDTLPAALVFKNQKSGFDQSVVLLANPGSPREWGFSEEEDVQLEMWTEWFDAPEPVRTPVQTAEGLESETLDFGSMQMIEGRAFVLQQEMDSVDVQKTWQEIEGRMFLIESVRYEAVAPMLEGLQARATPPARDLLARRTTRGRSAAASLLARRTQPPKEVQLAGVPRSAWPRNAGFVLDYEFVNSSQTNFTFKGDGTYYVSGPSYLYQTTTIEGGAVVKFANTNSTALWVQAVHLRWPDVQCNADAKSRKRLEMRNLGWNAKSHLCSFWKHVQELHPPGFHPPQQRGIKELERKLHKWPANLRGVEGATPFSAYPGRLASPPQCLCRVEAAWRLGSRR